VVAASFLAAVLNLALSHRAAKGSYPGEDD
jgi:hypothetical protein